MANSYLSKSIFYVKNDTNLSMFFVVAEKSHSSSTFFVIDIFLNDLQFLMTFTQLTARLKNFFRGWPLLLGLKECLVEYATLCIKSEVILVCIKVIGYRSSTFVWVFDDYPFWWSFGRSIT